MISRKAWLAASAFAIAISTSVSAYAWTIKTQDEKSAVISCQDSSTSIAAFADGNWTVVKAGDHGKSGGKFSIVGQAAQWGCGE